ncbi:MAG: hypothetical protein JRI97_13165, partial [Deltaproteobacteria bacterium]|nr:hypothetical protein [Deltaproteobacteria bacterium]
YLLGFYLLSRLLFRNRLTVILVCAGSILSLLWLTQLLLNFRIIHLLPLILYFLLMFRKERQGRHLWMAGAVCVLALLGSPPAVSSVYFLLVTATLAVFLLSDKSLASAAFRLDRANLAFFALFAALASLYLYSSLHALELTTLHDFGRDQATKKVSLDLFLKWENDIGLFHYFTNVLAGINGHKADASLYIPLLLTVFFLYSLVRVRTFEFYLFLVLYSLFLWVSFGGVFAVPFYYFPGMAYFRHLKYLLVVAKVFMLVLAGLGLDHFLGRVLGEKAQPAASGKGVLAAMPARTKKLLFALAALAVVLFVRDSLPGDLRTTAGVMAADFGSIHAADIPLSAKLYNYFKYGYVYTFWPQYYTVLPQYILSPEDIDRTINHIFFNAYFFSAKIIFYAVGFIILFYLFRRIKKDKKRIVIVYAVFSLLFVADTILYKSYANLSIPKINDFNLESTKYFNVHPLSYQAKRLKSFETDRQRRLFVFPDYSMARHTLSFYGIAQFDPCFPKYKFMFLPEGFSRLVRLRGGRIAEDPFMTWKSALPEDDPAFMRVLGCGFPKVRMVNDAVVAQTREEAERLVRETKELDKTVVLGPGPDLPAGRPLGGGEAEVVAFSPNRTAISTASNGAWLVYADSFHPGWKAFVDGARANVHKAYLAFKAVYVPPGEHLVEFVYFDGILTVFSHLIAAAGLLAACA